MPYRFQIVSGARVESAVTLAPGHRGSQGRFLGALRLFDDYVLIELARRVG
jgi:hypothetical protein